MKAAYGVVLIALLFAPASISAVSRERCDSIETEDSLAILYKDAPIEKVAQIVQPKATFVPDARVVCVQAANFDYPRQILDYQVEYGTQGSFGYRIYYTDGSGSVTLEGKESDYLTPGLWGIGCEVDSMDDSKSCYLNKEHLFIWYAGGDNWRVHVGDGSNYPDTEVAVRLGDSEAIRGKEPSFSLEQSRRIVEGLTQEPHVRTRYFKWPSGVGDDEFQAAGFAFALELLKWTHAAIEP